MPREPILSRELHYSRVRGSIYFHNYALVNTSLGGMIETRSYSGLPTDGSAIDMVDSAIDSIVEINSDEIPEILGTSGLSAPINFGR